MKEFWTQVLAAVIAGAILKVLDYLDPGKGNR